jgi:hypothetical protein
MPKRHPQLRSRWGRPVAFVTVLMSVPAISAASLSTMSSKPAIVTPEPVAVIELGSSNGCPKNMARVGSNCIDK